MAVPKGRASKARTRRRHSINMRIAVPSLVFCPSCGNKTMRHRMCPQCGTYKQKQIIEPEDMG